MSCFTNAKFTMVANIIRNYTENVYDPSNIGGYKTIYDELTGEVSDIYVEADLIPNDGKNEVTLSVPCLVTPSYTVSQANDLQYKGTRIIDTERLIMKVASRYHLYTTDRVTDIRTKTGELIFEDDQRPRSNAGGSSPAVYNIVGVLPVTDPFGTVVERQVQLEKVNT